MCRHLAYVGPPLRLSSLITDPPHSLVHQSYAPRDMRGGGTVSVDGFGVGWVRGDGSVGRYRRAVPIWQDAYLPELVRTTSSTGVLAAVRGASPGMGSSETACAPFTDGRWLFSLNGMVDGWPDALAPLAGRLPVTDLMTLDAPTDAAVLWAVLSHQLSDAEPGIALSASVTEVASVAPASRLTCLLTDGTTVWATTYGHALCSLVRPDGGVVLASEPLDESAGWQSLPDRRLVTARPGAIDHQPLPL